MEILLLTVGLMVGIVAIPFYRYIIGYPFPWEITTYRLQNPETKGIKKCFDELKDGGQLDVVMGEMNSKIVNNKEVIKSLDNALKKNIKIRMIVGPEFDKKSKVFARHLLKSKKVKVYQLEKRPKIHFRLIDNKNLSLEPYHKPLDEKSLYWPLYNVRSFARRYRKIFDRYINDSTEITDINELSTQV